MDFQGRSHSLPLKRLTMNPFSEGMAHTPSRTTIEVSSGNGTTSESVWAMAVWTSIPFWNLVERSKSRSFRYICMRNGWTLDRTVWYSYCAYLDAWAYLWRSVTLKRDCTSGGIARSDFIHLVTLWYVLINLSISHIWASGRTFSSCKTARKYSSSLMPASTFSGLSSLLFCNADRIKRDGFRLSREWTRLPSALENREQTKYRLRWIVLPCNS